MGDYRSYLRSIGRKPIRGKIRTQRQAGDVEVVRDHRAGEYVLVRYGEGEAA